MSDKRPAQNSKGQAKQASANPDGAAKPNPQAPTSLVPPGVGGGGGGPMQSLRDTINYKDLDPILQMQMAQKAGLNPMSPIQMVQQNLQSSLAAGTGDQSPVPNAMVGPMAPPDVGGLPHDMGQLQQAMAHGYAPGSTYQEHAMATNAHAMMRAIETQAQQQGQLPQSPEQPNATSNALLPQVQQPAAPPMGMPMGAPPMGGAPQAPPMGPMAGPPGAPPMGQGAPPMPPIGGPGGGVPPAILQTLAQKAASEQPMPTSRKQLKRSK